MKKITIIIVISLCLLGVKTYSQDTVKTNNTIFYCVPQYVFNNGFRFDIEKHIRNKEWLVIAPQIFIKENSFDISTDIKTNYYDNERFDNMLGFGLDIYHKIELSKFYQKDSVVLNYFYFSYGLSYKYYTVDYSVHNSWEEYQDELITYLRYRSNTIEVNEHIHNAGALFFMGYKAQLFNNAYIDLYCGIGLRYARRTSNNENELKAFSDNIFDFGYAGTTPVFGAKIGFSL